MPSQLSQRLTANNFIALQSVQLGVNGTSASKTFTNLPGNQPVTMKITNTGTKGAYLASGAGTAIAVASSGTAQPTTGVNAVSNCDYIAAGAILTQDYIAGTDTIAAICGGADTTTLEISLGFGQ